MSSRSVPSDWLTHNVRLLIHNKQFWIWKKLKKLWSVDDENESNVVWYVLDLHVHYTMIICRPRSMVAGMGVMA